MIYYYLQKELGSCLKFKPSATEELIRLFKEQKLNEEKLSEEIKEKIQVS